MDTLTIGEVARRAEIGVETIRYYEREGLVPQPERSESGYRQFPPDTVRRLRFIVHAKRLGFSLKEIAELLSLRVDTPSTVACNEVREHAERKLQEVEERMQALGRMKDVLGELIDSCRGRAATDPCPILRSLEDTGG
ncbi:MAG: MerR family DNA-binding protein [Spirochaetes bacterium]|jgi:Hg(II)-responsive transcriptional regulator|nr:MerR family DNA-binding protein [Spirochaetota bacterium]